MKYQGSDQHRKNAIEAAKAASMALSAIAQAKRQEYAKNPKECLNCSGPIPYEKRSTNKFCKKSCSATYNNQQRGPHSPQTKEKISNTTRKSIERLMREAPHIRPPAVFLEKTCSVCKKQFSVRMSQKEQNHCSVICSRKYLRTDKVAIEKAKEVGRKNVERQMMEGKWKGWSGQGEAIRSFPEMFIEQRLIQDELPYVFQHQVSRYKIDFAFPEMMIALEVDGKQHKYPKQAESDKRKDDFLGRLGWKVFRLSWQSIKTEAGKKQVIDQYESFKKLVTSKALVAELVDAPDSKSGG